MVRPRKGRAAARKPPLPPKFDDTVAEDLTEDPQKLFNKRLVEQKITAIQATRDAETENLMSRLRYLRSCMTKEQLETPALKFFQENFPNLSVRKNEKYKVFELNWKGPVTGCTKLYGNGGTKRASTGVLQFSVDSVRMNFLNALKLQYPNFNLDDLPENEVAGTSNNSLQTPMNLETDSLFVPET